MAKRLKRDAVMAKGGGGGDCEMMTAERYFREHFKEVVS
jgi:hypothetical protein